MVGKMGTILPAYGCTPHYRMIRWTDGVNAQGAEYTDLTAFQAAVAGLNLNGDGSAITIFGDQTPAVAQSTTIESTAYGFLGALDQLQYAIDNVDNHWVCIGPRYPYPYQDYIHHTALGSAYLADLRAFIEYQVLDLGQTWLVFHMTAAYVQGTTLTIDFNQPLSNYFGQIGFNTSIIEADVQYGLRFIDNGAFVAISDIQAIPNSTRLTMTLASAPQPTDTIELSCGCYGPGENPGVHAGCWGNISMALGPSPIFDGEQIYCWAAIQKVTTLTFAAPPALPAITAINISSTAVAANQNGVQTFGALSAVTTGAVGAITWSLINNAGGYFTIENLTSVQAIADLPVGSFNILVEATPAAGQSFQQAFTIVSS
jgi:hypothetical protein